MHHPCLSVALKRMKGTVGLVGLLLALVASHAFPRSSSADQLEYYPGRLRIEKAKNLSRQEREVEARFAQYLEEHAEEAIARYKERFGKEINTDNARELSTDYAPGGIEAADPKSTEARSIWSTAVHEPASALVKEIYRRELLRPAAPHELNLVIFTAGGPAAGKTTAIRGLPQLANFVKRAQIIYDSTLSSFKSANDRISQALKAGKTVSIVYVHRDPVEAFINGALPQTDRLGRIVPLEVFQQLHLEAPKVQLEIANQYKNDTRVGISIIDNSRGRGKAAVADLKLVKSAASRYTPESLKAKLHEALEEAYEKGKRGQEGGISEAVYRAIKGNVFTGVHRSPRPGDGASPQPQNQKKSAP